MAENTKIQWATHTFNPWRGCAKIAPGCANCYADAQSKRNPGTLGVWGPNGTRVVASEAMWREPLKWNKAAACLETFDCNAGDHSDCCPQKVRDRVFCASLADVFEDWG
jgi:protein gp37